MRRLFVFIGMLSSLLLCTSAWADLASGSLSTSTLFDSSDYTKPPTPYESRTPVENPPGGLTATAAWDQYGMRLNWTVTANANGTYTYDYVFGPGWYPPDNGTKSNPWVTNKQVTAFDLQVGAGVTMADILNPAWSVYDYKKTLLGYGTATQWNFIDQTTKVVTTGAATLLAIGSLQGETGSSTTGYTTHDLFYGLQWLNPTENGNFKYPGAVNFELSFSSALAPEWGDFFANSTQTGSERDYEDVVAYDPFGGNTVSTPGGAPVPLPPPFLLLGSGLGGFALFRRRKYGA